jgi:hypothetical protein
VNDDAGARREDTRARSELGTISDSKGQRRRAFASDELSVDAPARGALERCVQHAQHLASEDRLQKLAIVKIHGAVFAQVPRLQTLVKARLEVPSTARARRCPVRDLDFACARVLAAQHLHQ